MKRRFIFSLICTLLLGVAVALPVFAQYGLDKTAGAAGLDGVGKNLPEIVGNVIGTALSMVAVLFFGLMIYGGILWMTARGNDDQTKKAFDTITAAVIGIAIVLASYAITSFAFKTIGGGSAGSGAISGNEPGPTQESPENLADGSSCTFNVQCVSGYCYSGGGIGGSRVCTPYENVFDTVCCIRPALPRSQEVKSEFGKARCGKNDEPTSYSANAMC